MHCKQVVSPPDAGGFGHTLSSPPGGRAQRGMCTACPAGCREIQAKWILAVAEPLVVPERVQAAACSNMEKKDLPTVFETIASLHDTSRYKVHDAEGA